MKCTIFNPTKGQLCYSRITLDEVCQLLKDGTFRPNPTVPPTKKICFSAEWKKASGQTVLVNKKAALRAAFFRFFINKYFQV